MDPQHFRAGKNRNFFNSTTKNCFSFRRVTKKFCFPEGERKLLHEFLMLQMAFCLCRCFTSYRWHHLLFEEVGIMYCTLVWRILMRILFQFWKQFEINLIIITHTLQIFFVWFPFFLGKGSYFPLLKDSIGIKLDLLWRVWTINGVLMPHNLPSFF